MTMPSDAPGEAVNNAAATANLDRSLIGGVAWTAGVKWLSQLLVWPATLIVVRLLSPADYGLVAMGSVYVSFVLLVNEFGLGSAIVQIRDLTDDQIAQIHGLSVLFGVAGFALSMAAAYPLAAFYRTPTVRLIVMALSINFFITSLKTVPLALLTRDLRFRVTAINEGIGAIVQSVALVAFAYFGFRHWALVIAFLASSLATSILAYVYRPVRLAWPRIADIRESVVFGSHLMGSRVAWYLYTYADFFVIGRVLGGTSVGSYSFGWSFASMPVEKVTSLVSRVAPPILSAVQDDLPALRRYVARLSSGIAVIAMPAGVGLGLVARDFVAVALGAKWVDATGPLRILALFAAFRSLVPIVSQTATAVGLARFAMRVSIASAIVMPIAFFVGTHWGTTGVAYGWLIVYPIVTLPLFVVVFRRIGMSAGEYLASLWPALSGTLAMIPAVLVVQRAAVDQSMYIRLAAEVLAGAAAYISMIAVFHRGDVRALVQVLKGVRTA